MRAKRPSAAVPADPIPPPDAPLAERLGWLFRRNGVLRRPDSIRQVEDEQRYH
jgi:hypothetical protein